MSQINIVATIKVKASSYNSALDLFKELVPASRAESGNIQYDLHQDIKDKDTFVIIETWASQDAVDEHNVTPHFKKLEVFVPNHVETLDIKLIKKIM